MIYFLRGKIKEIDKSEVILDVGGVGYGINCTERDVMSLTKKSGENVELHTYYYLRENAAELYGFLEKDAKEMFQILIGISGMGPKGALNVLNAAPLQTLKYGIAKGDTSVLTSVSGIGSRTAQKIIVELKDRFGEEWAASTGAVDISSESDAVEALESLGYSKAQAQDALSRISDKTKNTEDKIKEALKLLAQ